MTAQIEPAVGSLLATAIGQAVRTPLHSLLGFLELLGLHPVLAPHGLDDCQAGTRRQRVGCRDQLVAELEAKGERGWVDGWFGLRGGPFLRWRDAWSLVLRAFPAQGVACIRFLGHVRGFRDMGQRVARGPWT